MSKGVPGLDERTFGALRPLFVSPCHRWTSGSRFVDRTVLVSRDGLLYILNSKLEVTHSLLLRSPDLNMMICVEYEDNVLLGTNNKGANGSKQQFCVAISSSIKKATVLNWATFSLSERLGLEPDDGVVLAFSSSSVVADFMAAVSVFRQELEEKCRKAREMLAKFGQKEDDVLLQGAVDDFRITKVAAGEVMKRAQAARSRSGVARHDAPALAKAGQLRYLPDGLQMKKRKGLASIQDIAQAAAQSPMGSPIRVDRPLGLRHLPHGVIPKSVLLQRPPIPPEALDAIRSKLTAVYTRCQPEKVGDVDRLLERYKGLEDLLLLRVVLKYKDAPNKEEEAQNKKKKTPLPREIQPLSDCQHETELMKEEILALEERCDQLGKALHAHHVATSESYNRARLVRQNLCRVVADICVVQSKRQWREQEQELEKELSEIQSELTTFAKLF